MTEDEKIKFLKKMGYSGGTIASALGKEPRENYRPTRFDKYNKKKKEEGEGEAKESAAKPERKDNLVDKADLLFLKKIFFNPTNS